MITFKRLDHIQICIPPGKEDEARKFYTGLIGLKEISKPESLQGRGGLWYKMAGIELHIGTEEPGGPSKRHPAFEIEQLEETKTYLMQHGVKIREEIEIPGVKRFSFFDPFGNRVELLEKYNRTNEYMAKG